MNLVKIFRSFTGVGLFLSASLALAQDPNPPPPGNVPGKPGRPTVTTLPNPSKRKDSPGHPTNPDHPQTPGPVKVKLDAFKAAREKYLANKKNLTLNRSDLTEAQRQALLEAQKANREEFQQRMQEIKAEFRNKELNDIIDAARKPAEGARKRKGDD